MAAFFTLTSLPSETTIRPANDSHRRHFRRLSVSGIPAGNFAKWYLYAAEASGISRIRRFPCDQRALYSCQTQVTIRDRSLRSRWPCRPRLLQPWPDHLAALVWHTEEEGACFELGSRLVDPGWLLACSLTSAVAMVLLPDRIARASAKPELVIIEPFLCLARCLELVLVI